MDYSTVTEDIIRLTDDLNTWSSTLCIPVKDSEALLDIISAANGADSCVPPGAKNQPITLPKKKGLRSVYQFDTEVFFGESSWDDLRSMFSVKPIYRPQTLTFRKGNRLILCSGRYT